MVSIFSFFKNLVSNSKFRFLIGFLIIFTFQIWSTHKEVAKTFDSLHYLEAAQNLVLTQGFTQNQSYSTWALGFPFLLILFKDSIFLNLLCILGIYAFYFDLTQKLFQKTITKWWLILAFVFGTPIYLIHHFVWSEPPFLLFLIANSWAFYCFNYSNNNRKLALSVVDVPTNDISINYSSFLFCLFGFLFMSMRNAGLYFVVAISSGIVLFYILPSLYKSQKFKFSLIYQTIYFKILIYFSISSLISIFLWWFRAKPKTAGTFATMYSLAERTLVEEFFNYGDILSRWLIPPSIPLLIRVFLLLVFVICMLFLGTQATVKKILNRCSCPHERPIENTKFILFIFWITSFYLVGMFVSRAGMKVDAERYLAILYPFLCILIGFVLDKMKVNEYLKYGIAFLWLVYPFLRTVKNIIFWN